MKVPQSLSLQTTMMRMNHSMIDQKTTVIRDMGRETPGGQGTSRVNHMFAHSA